MVLLEVVIILEGGQSLYLCQYSSCVCLRHLAAQLVFSSVLCVFFLIILKMSIKELGLSDMVGKDKIQ